MKYLQVVKIHILMADTYLKLYGFVEKRFSPLEKERVNFFSILLLLRKVIKLLLEITNFHGRRKNNFAKFNKRFRIAFIPFRFASSSSGTSALPRNLRRKFKKV